MNTRTRAIVIATLALSATGLAILARSGPASGHTTVPSPAADARVESLTRDVERLSAEVEAMRRKAEGERAEPTAVSALPKDSAERTAAPPSEEERRRVHAEKRAEEIHQLEAKLHAETKDPVWAPAMERRIAEAFRAESAQGSTLRRSECGTSLCRLEVAHEDASALDRFSGSVATTLPFALSGFVDKEEGTGTAVSTIFITREEPEH